MVSKTNLLPLENVVSGTLWISLVPWPLPPEPWMRNKNGPKNTSFVSAGSMMTASHHTSADTKDGRIEIEELIQRF